MFCIHTVRNLLEPIRWVASFYRSTVLIYNPQLQDYVSSRFDIYVAEINDIIK